MNAPQRASSDPNVMVTICIPSFNRADLVGETLDSILRQSDPRWEAIVVDDGSTDDSQAAVSAYAARDPRVRLMVRDREPKGACTCRNIAVEHGRGRYVLFLDTDDILAPLCLEQRIAVMEENQDADFAIFPMLLFQGSIDKADRIWNIETGDDDLLRVLRMDPICQGTGTLWRRDSFIRAGMWDEHLLIWQDIELHLRAFGGKYRFVKRLDLPPDVYIRETDTSLSRGSYHSREKLESRALIARKAVALLRQNGRPELIPEVRHFASSVVLGAAAAGNLDIARETRRWGERDGVFSRAESWRLRFAELSRASRLDRVPAIRRLRDNLALAFQADVSLGQVRVTEKQRNEAPPDVSASYRSGTVSVVMPVRNEAARIAACIEGVLAQTVHVSEIIVVDSGSTDGTLDILRRYPRVRVIEIDPADFNHGDSRNLGVQNATSDWVVFTVGDARPADTRWIARLLEGVTDDDIVGVCGAQIVPHERDANPVEWFRPVSEPTLRRFQFSSAEEFDRLSAAEKLAACGWDDVTALYRREVLLRIPFRRTTFAE
ncbi:MAG: glycosyltransferase, partial [Gemmatimonadaceae bacterium]